MWFILKHFISSLLSQTHFQQTEKLFLPIHGVCLIVSLPCGFCSCPEKVSKMAGQSTVLALPAQVTVVYPHRQAALTFSPPEDTKTCAAHGQGTGSGLETQCPGGLGTWSRGCLGSWSRKEHSPSTLGQGYQLFLAIDGIDALLAEEATGGLFFQIITVRAELSPFHINPDK